MKFKARYYYRTFHFKQPGGTSRGILTEKHSWFIEINKMDVPDIIGTGECSIIPGLSPEYNDFIQYENLIIKAVEYINNCDILDFEDVPDNIKVGFSLYPSILFGLESALLDLRNGGKGIIFDNAFSQGKQSIPINGLIWMGSDSFMQQQIDEKIESGFKTIKMKIGAIDLETELNLLSKIRKKYSAEEITIRVDANGAFTFDEAINVAAKLEDFDVHSMEQPIKSGQLEKMAKLCAISRIPIALDEELISINTIRSKINVLDTIKPKFIILKPSLHGGISGTIEWIKLAEKRKIEWWMTSALESNIGLNSICQLAGEYDIKLPQGLGTGSLYTDNIPSKLEVKKGTISLNLAHD